MSLIGAEKERGGSSTGKAGVREGSGRGSHESSHKRQRKVKGGGGGKV